MTVQSQSVADLESVVVDKYQDLLDTILVIEAMKNKQGNGKTWKELKIKLEKHV